MSLTIGTLSSVYGDLKVNLGLTVRQVQELILYSNDAGDTAVANYTSDQERFASLDSYKTWVKKGRTIYSLVGKGGELAGIIWFGKKVITINQNKYDTTFAIRIYKKYRGHKLARPFSKMVMHHYHINHLDCQSIWLAVHKENNTAKEAYQKLGWNEVGKVGDRIIMTLQVA